MEQLSGKGRISQNVKGVAQLAANPCNICFRWPLAIYQNIVLPNKIRPGWQKGRFGWHKANTQSLALRLVFT